MPSKTEMPPYFVMLTQITPNVESRCSGAALDEWTVLTANHCVDRQTFRIETQYGQSSFAYPVLRFPESDIAILHSVLPLALPEYALLNQANVSVPASLFGVCPQHFSHVPREMYFEDADWFSENNIPCEKWIAQTSICGSDSGGFLVQDGQMIGMTIAVRSWWLMPGKVEGKEVCVVPSQVIMETISWQTYNN